MAVLDTLKPLTKGEALAAIRKHGIGQLEDVAAVVLETDGSFSVIGPGSSERLTTLADVKGYKSAERATGTD